MAAPKQGETPTLGSARTQLLAWSDLDEALGLVKADGHGGGKGGKGSGEKGEGTSSPAPATPELDEDGKTVD